MRKQISRIFCATDFSRFAEEVVTYGIRLAKEFNAGLYICHVVDLPSVSMYGEAVAGPIEYQNRFMEYARQEIERLVGSESIEYTPLVTIGNTTEEINRLAKDHAADLVITATHGRSGLKRLFLGSVTERLMRTLPCPLLVLKGAEEDAPRSLSKFPFRKILVGCDFSAHSDEALKYSLNMAQEFESEFHLVHVVEPSGYRDLFELASQPAVDRIKEDLYDMIKERLSERVPVDALNWISLKTQLLVGKPYEEIIRYAALNDIDLIAMGIRGHGMVEDLLIGSTTDRVIRRSPCPVLSVYMDS